MLLQKEDVEKRSSCRTSTNSRLMEMKKRLHLEAFDFTDLVTEISGQYFGFCMLWDLTVAKKPVSLAPASITTSLETARLVIAYKW